MCCMNNLTRPSMSDSNWCFLSVNFDWSWDRCWQLCCRWHFVVAAIVAGSLDWILVCDFRMYCDCWTRIASNPWMCSTRISDHGRSELQIKQEIELVYRLWPENGMTSCRKLILFFSRNDEWTNANLKSSNIQNHLYFHYHLLLPRPNSLGLAVQRVVCSSARISVPPIDSRLKSTHPYQNRTCCCYPLIDCSFAFFGCAFVVQPRQWRPIASAIFGVAERPSMTASMG